MPEIFFISDLHIGHRKVLEFEESRMSLGKTIEEHDEALVDRINSVVRPRDTLWILGDVVFGRQGFQHLAQMNGYKKLVMGNHDQYPIELYQRHFSAIKGAVKLEDFILTHIPIHPSQKFRFKGNIHGHLHSKTIPDPFYYNVSCERIDYRPIPFYQIRRDFQTLVGEAHER